MKKDELKKRASLADERLVNLFKRYPIVGALAMLIGFGLGCLVMWVFL